MDQFAMARKRAPGGGRKPQGEIAGKSAAFATRITPEVRRWLEAEAKKGKLGRSLSQVAEQVLRLEMHRGADTQKHNQALAHSIVRLAESIEQQTGKNWLSDIFTSMALRHAVETILFHFAPGTEQKPQVPQVVEERAARMPDEFAERYRKPAGFGYIAASHLITEIELSANPSEKPNEWSLPITFNTSADKLKQIGRDLGLVKSTKGKAK
jgi:hypothetical protein